jgi:phenylacetate-CoA ligase
MIATTPVLWRNFMKAPFLPPWKIRELQMNQFRRLIRHCHENIPFYRRRMAERGLVPEDFSSLDDIGRLPVLSKSEFKENLEDFFPRGTRKDRLIRFQSSGSTGEPTIFYAGREYEILRGFVHLRSLLLAGVGLMDRQLRLMAELQVKNRKDLLQQLGIYKVLNLSINEDFSRVVSAVLRYRPRVILVTPNYLDTLCDGLHGTEAERIARGLKCIVTRSEMLYPDIREKAESLFRVPVHDFYGLSEFGFVASQTEGSRGYCIAEDVNLVEIAGASPPDGGVEENDIVITALYNFTMPLIRYNTGDKAQRSATVEGPVRFRRLEKILGRSDDFIVLPDGTKINPLLVTGTFAEIPGLVRFRVFQESADRLKVRIQMRENRLPGDKERRLRHQLGMLTRGFMETDIRVVPRLDFDPMTKYRRILRKADPKAKAEKDGTAADYRNAR